MTIMKTFSTVGVRRGSPLVLGLLALLPAGMAWGDPVFVDPNFVVCASTAITNAATCGLHPNPIDGTAGFYAGVHEGNNPTTGPLDPFLIFVAVPNLGPGGTPTPGTALDLTVTPDTTALYGGTVPNSSGFVGNMTSGDMLGFVGVPGGNNSMSFPNFTGTGPQQNGAAESALLGGTPTSFAIYEFDVNIDAVTDGQGLGGNFIYDVPLTIPLGSYVAAYGIDQYPPPTQGNVKVFDSAFTVAGWVNTSTSEESAPEPGTVALLGIGLAGLAFRRRRSA